LTPTRFVDDIAISSHFDLKDSFVVDFVRDVLIKRGFAIKKSKEYPGRIDKGSVRSADRSFFLAA
jgi:hypothetical protein